MPTNPPSSPPFSRGKRDGAPADQAAERSKDRRPARPSSRDAERELARMDQKLLDLLEARAQLIASMRSGKKGRAPAEQHQEQRLWQAWEERANRSSGDKSRWRTLFTCIQDLPPPRVVDDEDDVAGFILAPKPEPIKAGVDAPGGVWESQGWALLAVQANTPATLRGVALNAPLVYLAKALNHAGAGFRWQHDQLEYRQGEDGPFTLDGKALFVGDDLVSCCGLLFLALGKHCRLRVTGDTNLKLTDLSPVARFVTAFQARLTPVVPGSKGLPTRLESAGLPPEEIEIPDDLPMEAFWALAMTAPSYEQGLTIRFAGEPFQAVAERAAALLARCMDGVECTAGQLRVPHAAPTLPTLPATTTLPMDALLATSLLAIPMCSGHGGEVTLAGAFPAHLSPWREGAALLEAAGMAPSIGPAQTRLAAHGPASLPHGEARLDSVRNPAYFPLSFALAACRMLLAEKHSVCVAPPTEADATACEELAARLGLRLELSPEAMRVAGRASAVASAAPWLAPNAAWALAYACLSMAKPGLPLANPGSITEVLPRFWNFYNTLPLPPQDVLLAAPPPAAEENSDGARGKKRRIRTSATLPAPRGDRGAGE